MLIATWGLTFGRTMGWGGVHHRSGVDLRKGSPRHDGGNEMARSLSVPLNLYFSLAVSRYRGPMSVRRNATLAGALSDA